MCTSYTSFLFVVHILEPRIQHRPQNGGGPGPGAGWGAGLGPKSINKIWSKYETKRYEM